MCEILGKYKHLENIKMKRQKRKEDRRLITI